MEQLSRLWKQQTGTTIRQSLTQLLNLALILSTAFMGYKALSVITDSESPVVVVLSGSMEPAFQRGDLLFLDNRKTFSMEASLPEKKTMTSLDALLKGVNVGIGDIVVYNIKDRGIPIVHRVVKAYQNTDEDLQLLTKGDNNRVDDTELYTWHQSYLDRGKDVVGVVRGYVPFVGYVTILLNDYPWLKYALLGAMGAYIVIVGE